MACFFVLVFIAPFARSLGFAQDRTPPVPFIPSQSQPIMPTQTQVLAELAVGELNTPGIRLSWQGEVSSKFSEVSNEGYTLDLTFDTANNMEMTLFHAAERKSDDQLIRREKVLRGTLRFIYQTHESGFRITIPRKNLDLQLIRDQHVFDYMGGEVKLVPSVNGTQTTASDRTIICSNEEPIVIQVETYFNRDLQNKRTQRKLRGTIEYQSQAHVVMAKLGFWPNNGEPLYKNWYSKGQSVWRLDLGASLVTFHEGTLMSGNRPRGEKVLFMRSGLNTQPVSEPDLFFIDKNWDQTETEKKQWGRFVLDGDLSIARMEVVAKKNSATPILSLHHVVLENSTLFADKLGPKDGGPTAFLKLDGMKKFTAVVVESPLPQFIATPHDAGHITKTKINHMILTTPVFKGVTTEGCFTLSLGGEHPALIGQAVLKDFAELSGTSVAGKVVVSLPRAPSIERLLLQTDAGTVDSGDCSSLGNSPRHLDMSAMKLFVDGSWPSPKLLAGSTLYLNHLRLGAFHFKDFVTPNNAVAVVSENHTLKLETQSYFQNFEHHSDRENAKLQLKGVEPRLNLQVYLRAGHDIEASEAQVLEITEFLVDYQTSNDTSVAAVQPSFSISKVLGGTIHQTSLPFRLGLKDNQPLTLAKGVLSGEVNAELSQASLKSARFYMKDFLQIAADLETDSEGAQILVPIGNSDRKTKLVNGAFKRTQPLILNEEAQQVFRKDDVSLNEKKAENESEAKNAIKGSVFVTDIIFIGGIKFQQTIKSSFLELTNIHILGSSKLNCIEGAPTRAIRGVFSFKNATGKREFNAANQNPSYFVGKFSRDECNISHPEITSENPTQVFELKTGAALPEKKVSADEITPSDSSKAQVDGNDSDAINGLTKNNSGSKQPITEQPIPLDEETNHTILGSMSEPDFAVFIAKKELASLWRHMLSEYKIQQPQELELDLYGQTMEIRLDTHAAKFKSRTKGNYFLDLFRNEMALIFRTRRQLAPLEASDKRTMDFQQLDTYLCEMLGTGITRFSEEGFQISFPSLFSFDEAGAEAENYFRIEQLAVLVEENGLYFLGTVQKTTQLEATP